MSSTQPAEITINQHPDPEGVAWLRANPGVVDWLDRSHRTLVQTAVADGTSSDVDAAALEGPPLRVKLQRYFVTNERDGHVAVKYCYPRGSGLGRRYAREPSFQYLPRTIRELLTCHTHIDIDFVNAHFVIFSQMYAKHGIACSTVDSYLADREVHLARLLPSLQLALQIGQS
jgi:hypothetical protein